MSKIKVGVVGIGRGRSMINYCRISDNAELVAVCDIWEPGLEKMKSEFKNENISYYTSYDEFLNHEMDAVVLANYATEHAPFAIKAMNKGLNVISEVLPCQTLKEAVELVETVESTGMKYYYLENYCYMPAPAEMKRLYKEGKIGEFRYGECEYVHNCETIWHRITRGDKNHWRNNMYATFYCTHSIGPILHITGLRPVSVTGFELPYSSMQMRMGAKSSGVGIEMVTLENGAIIKSIHGGLYRDSIWYSVYGDKGRMESAREDAENGNVSRIYINADSYEGEYASSPVLSYMPTRPMHEIAKDFGHGGSDYYSMWNCIESLKRNPEADVIDVYDALDMFLPGLCAYFSILDGGKPVEIPNMRDKATRDKYRHDTRCTDPNVAGDMLLPCYSKGNPDIPDQIYQKIKEKWERKFNK